ncbi:uncharacterized protein LOC125369935 [Ricinus communis]|uniref:uncharacterized protein LOC125369935 n=1 Tax=Ricinus communis TaxID=3988 RepID=UPI00201A51C2|nr:uncharacterized protein LOC125369935 [Ricinus communis]
MLLKQWKKENKTTNVWELLMHPSDHIKALIQALSSISVSTTATPKEMIKTVIEKTTRMITFSDEDLPLEERDHNKANFLDVVDYLEWLANIVPARKKDGKVRMCVDYQDLNKACPKNDFPLPYIDVIVDSFASNAMYSFMDGFSGYNQIIMAAMDKLKTSFITE